MMHRWIQAAAVGSMVGGAMLLAGCGDEDVKPDSPAKAKATANSAAVVDSLVREAEAFLLSGDYAAAMTKINLAIERDPARSYSFEARGFLHEKMGAFDKAAEDYGRAIQIAPLSVEPLMRRARLRLYLRNPAEALADCNAAIALDPKVASSYTFRAALHLETGEIDEAIADCDRANEIDPELFQAYINRGVAYQRKGDLTQAVREYTTAIFYHQNTEAYNNRGAAYGLLGRFAEAQADFTAAIQLDPMSPLAYDNRGTIHLKHQRADEAIADFSRVIDLATKAQETRSGSVQLGRRMARVYAFRAQAHLLMGDVKNAEADVAEGYRIDPTDEDVQHAQRKVDAAKGK